MSTLGALEQLGIAGVVIIAVILLLRELKPLILRNGKTGNPGNPGNPRPRCEAEIRHCIEKSDERQALRDTRMFEKMDKELEVLQSIDKSQALMCQKLDQINGGRGVGQ